jgi:hypothetical protein
MTSADSSFKREEILNRLAGEFLVASRLTQRGYMVTLQWAATISYDILAFDKYGNVAFIEVKSTASYPRRSVLQSKHANPQSDTIPLYTTIRRVAGCSTGKRGVNVNVSFRCAP